jgi:hypothetical protein
MKLKELMLPVTWGLLAARGVNALPQPAVAAPPVPASSLERQVVEFEKRRCTAAMRKDIGALGNMLSDDLIYTQKGGIRQNKNEYLAYVAAGKGAYTAYSIEHPIVHVVGSSAVIHGTFAYEIPSDRPPVHGELIYTAVYVLLNGHWQLTNWEETSKRK